MSRSRRRRQRHRLCDSAPDSTRRHLPISTFDFTAELWIHREMPGAWYFVTLPLDAADEIRATSERRGFGSVRVRAAIGDSTWDTSVFPDTTSGSFLLPVKGAIRDEQSIDVGDLVAVTIMTR